MWAEGLIDIVRVSVTNLSLAKGSNPHLEKVAQGAVAALSADEGVHTAAMQKVLARQDRRGIAGDGDDEAARHHRVGDHSTRCLRPDCIKVARLVDRHGGKVRAGPEAGEGSHWQVVAVQAARIAHVDDGRTKGNGEAAPD